MFLSVPVHSNHASDHKVKPAGRHTSKLRKIGKSAVTWGRACTWKWIRFSNFYHFMSGLNVPRVCLYYQVDSLWRVCRHCHLFHGKTRPSHTEANSGSESFMSRPLTSLAATTPCRLPLNSGDYGEKMSFFLMIPIFKYTALAPFFWQRGSSYSYPITASLDRSSSGNTDRNAVDRCGACQSGAEAVSEQRTSSSSLKYGKPQPAKGWPTCKCG